MLRTSARVECCEQTCPPCVAARRGRGDRSAQERVESICDGSADSSEARLSRVAARVRDGSREVSVSDGAGRCVLRCLHGLPRGCDGARGRCGDVFIHTKSVRSDRIPVVLHEDRILVGFEEQDGIPVAPCQRSSLNGLILLARLKAGRLVVAHEDRIPVPSGQASGVRHGHPVEMASQ